MRTILVILQKEFRQIFRNKGMLPIIFVMPIVQLLILANAATFEINGLKLFVIDKDQSSTSRQLTAKFAGTGYFVLAGSSFNTDDGRKALELEEADLILEIPPGFERELIRNSFNGLPAGPDNKSQLLLTLNAIDGSKAGVGNGYAHAVIGDFNHDLIQTLGISTGAALKNAPPKTIGIEYSFWYNPELNYKIFMVPGILVLLVTMIGAFLGGMNLVREKELGTIEQLNVTPIRKYQFIIGKLMPFWILALFELAFGLLIAKLIYDIPLVGSLGLIFAFAAVYLLVVLGIGLFISTFTHTQQQAMFISWFFLVIFILMSGLFTAIENMPLWAQHITLFNPIRYFIEVTRMVMIKGAGIADVQWHFMVIAIYALVINGLAVLNYRKTA